MAILRQNSIDFNSSSVEQTERLGERLGQLLQPYDVLALHGDLGAGKTALARGIGRGWNTAVRVTSPTFTLVNEYPRQSDGCLLYHLDCYRLQGGADAETLGLEDIFDHTAVVMIEWPERIADWLPPTRLDIELAYINPTRRSLRLTAHGDRAATLLRDFKQAAFGIKQ